MLRIGDHGVSAAYDRLRQREVEDYFEALDGDENICPECGWPVDENKRCQCKDEELL